MSPSKLRTVTENDIPKECIFCKRNTVDEFKYGQLYTRDGVTAHYFCVLLSSALNQNGEDSDGILGFLPLDILKEARRAGKLRCYICKKKGAPTGCNVLRCKRSFHFPCGLDHGENFRFLDNYESFCAEHRKVQNIFVDKKDWQCTVCLSTIDASECPLTTTCCKTAVFHKDCVQHLALNTGYYFKCPKCNDTSTFVPEMKSMGIYVPDSDASWERDNNFADLTERNFKCDAVICLCPEGRKCSGEEGDWTLAHCQTCASVATHQKCGNIEVDDIPHWSCTDCSEIVMKLKKKRENVKRVQKKLWLHNGKGKEEEFENFKSQAWKISDLRFGYQSIKYFPFTASELKIFDSQRSIPDWRNLQLRVNLARWIKSDNTKDNIENAHALDTEVSSANSSNRNSPKPLGSGNTGQPSSNAPRTRRLAFTNSWVLQGDKRKCENQGNSGTMKRQMTSGTRTLKERMPGEVKTKTVASDNKQDKNKAGVNRNGAKKTRGISPKADN